MKDQLDILLRSAELNVVEFDIHRRNDLGHFNRILPYYVMSYHKKGSAKLRIGKEVHCITPGMVVCIPPLIEHDHYKDDREETEFMWWHFTFQIPNVLDIMNLFQIPVTFRLQNAVQFEQVFGQFMESKSKVKYLPAAILEHAKSLELLYMILDSAIDKQSDPSPQTLSSSFLGVLARMMQNPLEEMSLHSLSKELHLHPSYICTRFKELFGKSPMQVRRELKINKAKTLLESSEISITEISQAIGFNEIQSFSRLFKSQVGVSPTQYRSLKMKWRT